MELLSVGTAHMFTTHLITLFSDCGRYIVSSGIGGIITSPEYPLSYKPITFCEWHIKASNIANKIQIEFAAFGIEGDRQSALRKFKINLRIK